MSTITLADALKFIRETNGRFFSVCFVKRTTGELREMHCRTGVKVHLSGGPAAYNFSDKGLVSVWDLKNEGYRTINIEGIQRVKMNGEWFVVIHPETAPEY